MAKMRYWSKSFRTGHYPGKGYKHQSPSLTDNQKQAMINSGVKGKPYEKWTVEDSERYQAELKRLSNGW